MSASPHRIEATLCPDPEDSSSDFKADIDFTYLPGAAPILNDPYGGDPGWDPEVEILNVTPVGIVGPFTDVDLRRLAWKWINDEGGYDACCRRATDGGWE